MQNYRSFLHSLHWINAMNPGKRLYACLRAMSRTFKSRMLFLTCRDSPSQSLHMKTIPCSFLRVLSWIVPWSAKMLRLSQTLQVWKKSCCRCASARLRIEQPATAVTRFPRFSASFPMCSPQGGVTDFVNSIWFFPAGHCHITRDISRKILVFVEIASLRC